MIEAIEKIKDFGIFRDFSKPGDLPPFSIFNIFYGWNASGKSTFSRLVRSFETGSIPEGFGSPTFKIKMGGSDFTQETLLGHGRKIFVFNHDFVNDNIDWNKTVKSVLLVSKEKIDERKRLVQLKDEYEKAKVEGETAAKQASELSTSIDGFGTNVARNIKQKMKVIDTSDAYFLNYTRVKFNQLVETIPDMTALAQYVLTEEEAQKVTDAVRPDLKAAIGVTLPCIKKDVVGKTVTAANSICAESVVAKTIQRLKENPDINAWVESGIQLQKQHKSTACEFCGQEIPTARVKELEAHFSDNLRKFRGRLVTIRGELKGHVMACDKLPDQEALYPELRAEYLPLKSALETMIAGFNGKLSELDRLLGKREADPFTVLSETVTIDDAVFSELAVKVEAVGRVINLHNAKTANFNDELKKQKRRLEMHYAAQEMIDFKYDEKKKEAAALSVKITTLTKANSEKLESITTLERSLSNESLGAVHFNERLHKFLGHKEIALVFDEVEKGYKIQRNKSSAHAKNLSEGEKTAIGFIYFMTKVREKDNKPSECILVIDDPVSSFDSNNIFHSYSFLIHEFGDAKQLFVLTHNFQFFRLIRDWADRKNKKDKVKSRFYAIEAMPGEARNARIIKASQSLIDYDSEYHYLFQKLFSFREKKSLEIDEALLIGNVSRKLLESFLSFKFPKKRNNFADLMEVGIKDAEKREKIYRFINRYSHNQTIETRDSPVDNLMGEGSNIVQDILDVIVDLDKNHHDELIEVVNPS